MIRRPRYLDESLLQDLLDYVGVDEPSFKEVSTTDVASRGGQLGIQKVATVGVSGDQQAERTELFAKQVSAASQLTTLIEALSGQGMLIDLEADPQAPLVHRQPVEVSGELILEPASEIGQLFALALPKMMSAGSEELSDSEIWEILAGSSLQTSPSIVMSLTNDASAQRFMMVLDPKHVRVDDIDDLEGDMTVLESLTSCCPKAVAFPWSDTYFLKSTGRLEGLFGAPTFRNCLIRQRNLPDDPLAWMTSNSQDPAPCSASWPSTRNPALPGRLRRLPTRQVVVVDGPHPPVELVTVAATSEPAWSSSAVPSACP
jgi:hypothetical protein